MIKNNTKDTAHWGIIDLETNEPLKISNSDISIDANIIQFCSDVTSESVAKFNTEIRKLDVKLQQEALAYGVDSIPIKLYVSSFGGSVFAGISAMDTILNCNSPVHTYVDGYVSSAGTFFSIVGKNRYMYRHSYMLIHQLSSSFWGKMDEIEDEKVNLDRLHSMIKNLYIEYANVPIDKLDEIMKHDLWWDAETCLEYGLIDTIL